VSRPHPTPTRARTPGPPRRREQPPWGRAAAPACSVVVRGCEGDCRCEAPRRVPDRTLERRQEVHSGRLGGVGVEPVRRAAPAARPRTAVGARPGRVSGAGGSVPDGGGCPARAGQRCRRGWRADDCRHGCVPAGVTAPSVMHPCAHRRRVGAERGWTRGGAGRGAGPHAGRGWTRRGAGRGAGLDAGGAGPRAGLHGAGLDARRARRGATATG